MSCTHWEPRFITQVFGSGPHCHRIVGEHSCDTLGRVLTLTNVADIRLIPCEKWPGAHGLPVAPWRNEITRVT